MRRQLIFPLLLGTGGDAVFAGSGFAFLASASAGAAGGAATTAAIDTTGADLIVIALATNGSPSITDSAGNTWIQLTNSANSVSNRIYYCINPTTSATHTFTASATGFPSIAVLAFSGSGTITTDGEAGGTGTSTGPSPGSGVTPTQNNAVVVASCGYSNGNATAIDNSFTLGPAVSFLSGQHFGVAIGYLIQTIAAAADPNFTLSSSTTWASRCAAFKP